MSKVIVTGFFDRQNYGDDLFKYIYEQMFSSSKFARFKFEYVSTDDLDELMVAESHAIVLGGGDVMNSYFLERIECLVKHTSFKGPVYALSCGIPYVSVITEGKLDMFSYIVCRAKKDARLLKQRYGSERIRYHPDLSILLPKYMNGLLTKSTSQMLPRRFVASTTVAVTLARPIFEGNLAYSNVVDNLATFVEKIATSTDNGAHFEVYLIPFNTRKKNSIECDTYINDDVFNRLSEVAQERVHVINDTLSIQAMYNAFLNEIDYGIHMRYHAHMLSVVTKTPFLSIAVSPKVKNLLDDLSLSKKDYFTVASNGIPSKFDHEVAFADFQKLTVTDKSFNRTCTTYMQKYIDDGIFEDTLYTLLNTKETHTTLKTIAKEENVQVIVQRAAEHVLKFFSDKSTTTHVDTSPEAVQDLIMLPGKLNQLVKQYKMSCTSEFLSALVCYEMIRIPYPKYHYGMAEKILNQDFKFGAELKWVWNDYRLNEERLFLKRASVKNPLFNATYVGVEDFKGCHRSGWQYVVERLMHYHSEEAPIILDNYIDRTFHWAEDIYSYTGLLPITKPWCGFIHHTFDTDYTKYNVPALFKKDSFLKSLPSCKAIFTLSNDLAIKIKVLLQHHSLNHIQVISFVHPTEVPDIKFDFARFVENKERNIVQIGAWLRDPYAIYELQPYIPSMQIHGGLCYDSRERIGIKKSALRGKNMSNYFKPESFTMSIDSDTTHVALKTFDAEEYKQVLSNNNKFINGLVQNLFLKYNSVNIIDTLDNTAYDTLLSENIVFLSLVDASAVNTVIECIVRCTPLLVNRHPAVEEMLGTQYPFYYESMAEANIKCTDYELIRLTHSYLVDMPKVKYTIEYFKDQVEHVMTKLITSGTSVPVV